MTKINGSMIRQLDNIFPGASLIVSSFNDEAPVDLMEKIAYTIKEVNAFFGCHQFVATRVFTVNNFSQAKKKKLFCRENMAALKQKRVRYTLEVPCSPPAVRDALEFRMATIREKLTPIGSRTLNN